MAKEQDFYRQVADTLIEKMKAGVAPWQKSWDTEGMWPMNPTTGKRYRGGNVLHLMMQDRADPRWMTYRQAEDIGAQVKKGEHGTRIIYWQFEAKQPCFREDGTPVLGENGKPVMETTRLERPRAFISTVFNAEQIEGLPPLAATKERDWNPIDRAEKLLSASGAKILHRAQPGAYYAPREDHIVLPMQHQFHQAEDYYATALHELGHWTGHETRLNREFGTFGSKTYAKEELRAEIASMMLGGELGLPAHKTLDSHAAYVSHWIETLEKDPKEIFRAAADAEKILEYVMGAEQRLEQVTHQKHTAEEDKETPPLQLQDVVKAYQKALVKNEKEEITRLEKEGKKQGWSNTLELLASLHHERVLLQDELFKNIGNIRIANKISSQLDMNSDKLERLLSRVAPIKNSRKEDKKYSEKSISEKKNAKKRVEQSQNSPRQYLSVPYEERNEAKAVGAKWDSVARSWYIGPEGDRDKLKKWLPDNQPKQMSTSPQEEFAEVLRTLGFIVEGEHPIMDGKPHRIADGDDRPGQKAGFYVGYLDGRPAGYAKNNRSDEEIRWKFTGPMPSIKDQEAFRVACEARRQERAEALEKVYEETAKRLSYQLSQRKPVSEPSPYMLAKGITVHAGARQGDNGTICLPAMDVSGKVWSMQYINADGSKRYAKNSQKEGTFHPVGGMAAVLRAPALVICEGYATACSVAERMKFATIAAFDSGNVVAVAKALREKYPEKPIVIAGDDDRDIKINAGRNHAEQAARATGGIAVFPTFAPSETGKQFTDFNDLAVKSVLGAEAVRRQIGPAVEKAVQLKRAELAQKYQQKQHQAPSQVRV